VFETTKSGGIIRNPHGETVGLHSSGGSDTRTISNLKADLARIGFFDACDQLSLAKRATARATTTAARKKTSTAKAIVKPAAAASHSSASTDDVARPSAVRGMMTRSEQITPERAEQLLARAVSITLDDGTQLHQRRVFESEVTRWVQTISRGQWIADMPEGISFAPDGSLINGRHRLTALVKTGKTLGFRVHYNVPAECFASIDTGRTRRAADALTMAGFGNVHQLTSALKLQTCYDMWLADPATAPHWTRWNTIVSTNQDIVDASHRYPDMGQHVRDANTVTKPSGLNQAALAVFLHSSLRAWPDGEQLITDFRLALQTGEDIRRGDAPYELREWARRVSAGGAKQQQRHRRELHLRLLFRTFEYYGRGKTLRAVPRIDDRQPMIAPFTPGRTHAAA
jgi:hypothetical protein